MIFSFHFFFFFQNNNNLVAMFRPPLSQRAIAQVVESTLKDSDAIDTESLCIIANEKVSKNYINMNFNHFRFQ